jgi:hypothetical protein
LRSGQRQNGAANTALPSGIPLKIRRSRKLKRGLNGRKIAEGNPTETKKNENAVREKNRTSEEKNRDHKQYKAPCELIGVLFSTRATKKTRSLLLGPGVGKAFSKI